MWWGVVVVVVILVAIGVGVFLIRQRAELLSRARIEAGMRVSHLDCQELLLVLPGAPEGLEGSGGEAVIVGPSGSQVRVNLTWRGYDGPVAKWEAGAQRWYAGPGTYIVVSAGGADFLAQNTPQEYTLTCGVEAPSPTATPIVTQPPSVTPIVTASPTPTGVLVPTPTSGVGGDPVPTVTNTPVPTVTSVPTVTATTTPLPSPTSVPTATPMPTATPTITPTPTTTNVGGGPTNTPTPTSAGGSALAYSGGRGVTPTVVPVAPVSGEAGPTMLFLVGGGMLMVAGWWLWRGK